MIILAYFLVCFVCWFLPYTVLIFSSANTNCLRKKEEIRMSKENGLPLIGVMEPTCDANGEYAPAQCEGSV